MTNDSTTQRMFPLLGLEISEGNTLREDLRHQGVHVLAVRGPAQHAGGLERTMQSLLWSPSWRSKSGC